MELVEKAGIPAWFVDYDRVKFTGARENDRSGSQLENGIFYHIAAIPLKEEIKLAEIVLVRVMSARSDFVVIIVVYQHKIVIYLYVELYHSIPSQQSLYHIENNLSSDLVTNSTFLDTYIMNTMTAYYESVIDFMTK